MEQNILYQVTQVTEEHTRGVSNPHLNKIGGQGLKAELASRRINGQESRPSPFYIYGWSQLYSCMLTGLEEEWQGIGICLEGVRLSSLQFTNCATNNIYYYKLVFNASVAV